MLYARAMPRPTGPSCVAVLCALTVGCSREPKGEGPAQTPAASTRANAVEAEPLAPDYNVVLLGIDGLTDAVVSRLLEEGKLKNFQYLREHGSYGRVTSIDPTSSPPLWATIATGMQREKHGITDFTTQGLRGKTIPVNRTHRRTKAIWNILSERKKSVGVVGYFTTWPAEEVSGFLISDVSVLPVRRGYHPPDLRTTMCEVLAPYIACGAEEESKVGAKNLDEQFEHFTPRMLELFDEIGSELVNDYDALKRATTYAEDEREQYRAFLRNNPLVAEAVFDAGFVDRMRFEYAKKLYRPDLDFFTLYLKGPDIVSHHSWGYYEPGPGIDAQEIHHYKDLVPNYYLFIDRVLGYFLEAAGPDTVIVLVADHGFERRASVLIYDVNALLHTLGYLEYGPDRQIRRDRIFDPKEYWWRDVERRELQVDLETMFPNRDLRQDSAKLEAIMQELRAIRVGEMALFEQVQSFPKKKPGRHVIQVVIDRRFGTPAFQRKHPKLEQHEIRIGSRDYPLSDYFEYSLTEGQHSTTDGVVGLIGPAIRASERPIEGLSVLDITPTLLRIYGLPIATDMDGSAPTNVFRPEFLLAHPVRYVDTYETPGSPREEPPAEEAPTERNTMEQLRSLGYVQ